MRCTTLVKLPVALSGGSNANCAPEHGYDSPSAFTAMFRKVLGVAPTEYFR
jgi:AraC-like DNA-binding protein